MGNLDVVTSLLVRLLGIDPLNVPGPVALIGFVLSVVLITAIVFACWTVMRMLAAQATDILEVETTTQRIVIARGLTRHDFEQVRKSIRGWHLLLVRYGSEDYLRAMAGEDDRHVGRPRYATSGMNLSLSPTGEVTLKWSLPVHRRLGTQFRCFVETRAGAAGPPALMNMLKHYDEIEVLEPAVREPRRVYFLLKRFPIVVTADGTRQNFVHPE